MAELPEASTSSTQVETPPDLMNDPRFATNTSVGEDGTGDIDTCRICRGEGTDSEQLFHPCKCSGSIKYVHQDCLMEWLSHSQKKHCELCKTPFRFTKLYSPNMPQSLPFPVLMRHVVIHVAKNLATWLRLCLVVIVWLAFLPYILRQVWRLLFWFSDGGWPPNHSRIDIVRNHTVLQALQVARDIQLASLSKNGSSPVTPLQAAQTSPANIGGLVGKLAGFLVPISQTLNISGADPLATGLLKSLYYGFGIQSVAIPEGSATNSTTSNHLLDLPYETSGQSVLSEVSFLRNLTRNAYFNQLVITIAEGYIISVLVVVCFILVFLIREWVVQQQPGINMGAGFPPDPEFARPERPVEQRPQAEVPPRRNPEGRRVARAENRDPIFQVPDERPIARPRRRNVHFGDADQVILPTHGQDSDQDQTGPSQADIRGSLTDTRPPLRETSSSTAVEIQRGLGEEPRMTEEFLAIWRRADSDPQEVLRIIEREDKGDQMRYWANAMRVLQKGLPQDDNHTTPSTSSVATQVSDPNDEEPKLFDIALPKPKNYSPSQDAFPAESGRSSGSSETWVDVPKAIDSEERNVDVNSFSFSNAPASQNQQNHRSIDKGKGKAKMDQDPAPASSMLEPFDLSPSSSDMVIGRLQDDSQKPRSNPFAPSTSRPRAVSDGPQRKDNISLLANNNWTFSNLPENENSETKPSNTTPLAAPFPPKEFKYRSIVGQVSSPPSSTRGEPSTSPVMSSNPSLPVTDVEIAELDQSPPEVIGQDGTTHTYRNVEDLFTANQVEGDGEVPEPDPFRPDPPLPEQQAPVAPQPVEARGFLGNIAEFLWGGVVEQRQEEQGGNDEHIVQDLAAEAPFVPVNPALFDLANAEQVADAADDAGAPAAPAIDPNDQDAIEDAEDFEGIMELVGMRGPLFSLVQNALFSAFLLALAVSIGVWIPYNIGRTSLLLLANPGPAFKLPLRFIFGCIAFLQDLTLTVLGIAFFCLMAMLSWPLRIWSYYVQDLGPSTAMHETPLATTAVKVSSDAFERMFNGTANTFVHVADSEIFVFSAASHESLNTVQSLITNTISRIGSWVVYLFSGDYSLAWRSVYTFVGSWLSSVWNFLVSLPRLIFKPDTYVISLEVAERSVPLDPALSVWDGWARFWAIFTGYTLLCILGILYTKKRSPFSTGQAGREWEASFLDVLNQAGGVLKVILIISIEMLLFPLYCGLLLDAALLPLFDDATIMSRIRFTIDSPFTSMFVHWFVGTCYMFHFALFVSMCRKIMRRGVLYFIRDPDDPTFHPVRDVLERNVSTQLRKILFSALVYGALVVVCLGGVVWGLAVAFKSVLPIHWSSNEPVLEFPIDLLFYNFLMPLAVKFFKPSDGLHAMYSWWFRQCARMLRLTWFLFDERKPDEEGYSVRRSWTDLFKGLKGDPMKLFDVDDDDDDDPESTPFTRDPEMRAYFVRDGKYVRAPASDQVRIPKGEPIFLEVDEFNNLTNGNWDRFDGPHGRNSEMYKQAYIPPCFQLRICLFILFIWLFAAITGVGITIVPLVFGRYVFAKIIPPHVRKNDIYAFSIGIYILGSTLYAILHIREFLSYLRTALAIDADTPHNVLRRATTIVSRVSRIAWTYGAFVFILPTLFAFVVEFYFIVPLHTYFSAQERHTVHFVQSWTLGLLYVKITTRLILWYEHSRPAMSLKAITRNGYLNPDAKLATRSFILPAVLILSTALFFPWSLARIAAATVWKNNPESHILIYRYSHPMFLVVCCVGFSTAHLFGMLKEWRMMIRDEVYLIGERLHNFGDRKPASPGVASSVASVRRLET